MSDATKFRFCIDRGGTFTDVYAEVPQDGSVVDTPRIAAAVGGPASYPNAPRGDPARARGGERRAPRDAPLDASRIEWIRMGTTVATNGCRRGRASRS